MIDCTVNPQLWPTDRKPGCLFRKSAPGVRFPLASERVPIIDRSDWEKWRKENPLGLRPFVQTILDQDGVGSCATEATAGAVMICRAFAGLPHVLLNPWFIYHATSGGLDAGSSIDDNLEFAMEYGIAPESVWPRSNGWRATPSQAAYEAAKAFRIAEVYDVTTVDELVSCMLQGYAVVYGSQSHAVVMVQHLDASKGNSLNSWGEDWGDGGFGVWATYSQINWGYGAWAVRAMAP